MITSIIQNVALLVAIMVAYQFVVERWRNGDWRSESVIGLLFGAVGLVSMMTPFVIAPGVVVDGRSIILAVAGFFGGPVVALIAAIMCAAYRISMGGAGVGVGVAVIAASSLIGVGFYYLRRGDPRFHRPTALWGFGFLVHLVMVFLFWFVPEVGGQMVRETAPIVLLLFPLATLFVCKVFLERERQIETEKKLFASEESYRTTLMSIGDAVISTDPKGRVALMNSVAEDLTGWCQEEAAGLPLESVFRIISETSRKEVENPASRVIREGIVVGLANHTLLIARDGTERPIADSAAPIWDSLGCLTGVVLVFRDQTLEREAEEKVTKSERLLSDLMSHLPGMVYRCKNDAGCPSDFISDGCLELTGHPPEVIRDSSRSDQIALLVSPEDQARIREETERAVREDRPYLLNYRLQTATGKIKWVEERGRVLVEQDSLAPTIQGFVFDVTERREAEEEKDRLESELRHGHKMEAIGRLAGGVAHDFNNMLSVINGYAELAQSAAPGSDVSTHLSAILEAGKRSADLTRKLLAFARKQTITPQILDLNQTVGGMLDMLKRLIGENIEVVWRPGESLYSVNVDPAQIDQVMINLVINARDAIAVTGVITISTENVVVAETDDPPLPEMPPGVYLRISVADDGRGMEEDLLPHVFEPFFTTKATGEGTGLGLATVHGIVTQNGGFVDVSSVEGKGTVFRLYLPGYGRKQDSGPVPAQSPSVPVASETILLAEDEPSILKLAQFHLRNLGYEVLAADSPTEAIRLAREFQGRISLLVTDVIMPGMNGHELWLHLNKHDDLRCLYMSGYTADHIQERGILLENTHFLQKPFTLDGLTAKVREAIAGEPQCSN